MFITLNQPFTPVSFFEQDIVRVDIGLAYIKQFRLQDIGHVEKRLD